jgi:hypothetical protein
MSDTVVGVEARHPLDPDPVRSSKATVVLLLGVVSVLMGPLVGGLIPATVALVLARQARADLAAASGYLVGSGRLRLGTRLAWVGAGLGIAALVVAVVIGIVSLASGSELDFPNSSN